MSNQTILSNQTIPFAVYSPNYALAQHGPHDCFPDCPMMQKVIEWYASKVQKAGEQMNKDELAFMVEGNMDVLTFAKNQGKISSDFYNHSKYFAETYSKLYREKLAEAGIRAPEPRDMWKRVSQIESPQAQAIEPGGTPLTSSYIHEILSCLGFPRQYFTATLTNEIAAGFLLHNMGRIKILAQEGKISRLQLRQIKYFAMDNINALEERVKEER